MLHLACLKCNFWVVIETCLFCRGRGGKVLFLAPVSSPFGQSGSCSPQMSLRPQPYGPGVLMQMET